MDLQIILLLSILIAAIFLFSFEWVSAEVIALGVLITLILTRLLPADQAFAGFGSDTVMMILGLLMPLAFTSILTSSVTLISTSTNIVVSGLITRYEMAPIQMFELAPVGLPIAVVGVIYMLTLGRRMIPERTQAEELTGEFGLRPYLTEIVILPESPLIGKTLVQANLGRDLDLTVLRLERGKQRYIAPQANLVLQENDVLMVEGIREQILKIKNASGIDIKADVKFSDPDLQIEDTHLVEAIRMPRSPLIGRTLKRLRFRERYGLQVLAINRHGETIRNKISQVVLRMGDLLLLQGHCSNIAALEGSRLLNVLGAVEENALHVRRAPLAIAIFVGALAAGTFNLVPFPVAVLLGALLAFLTPLEPSCMIIYGPGRYRFMDFFKVGSLLTGIIFILAILLVPSVWPFM